MKGSARATRALSRTRLSAAALLVGSAVAVAACGGSSESEKASTAAAPSGAAKKELTKVKFLTSSFPTGHTSPFFLGLEKGFFKEAGIDLEITDGTGTGPTIQAVASGQYDIGNAAMSSVALAAGSKDKPADLKVIAGWMRKTDLTWFVDEKSGIKSAKDLEGHSLLYSPESLETPFLPWFWSATGVDPKKVKLVTTSLASKYQTYSAKKADAMVTVRYGYSPIAPSARPSSTIDWAEYGIVIPSFGLFTNAKFLADKPEVAKAFVAAAIKSYEYSIASAAAQEEATDAQMKNRPDAARPILLAGLKDALNFLNTPSTQSQPLGWNSEEDWAKVLDHLKKEGVVREDLQPTDIFTNDLIPAGTKPASPQL
jgi:NitT/TauT family transport system substrate-binding protein